MVVAKAPVLDEIHVVCDWLEYSVLCSQYGTFPFATLQREWDTHRNQEDKDPEGGEAAEESFIESIKAEIRQRQEILDQAYPFHLSDSGESLEETKSINFGQCCYVLCLILSHPKSGAVLTGKYVPEINNMVRDYFQAVATLAAANEVNGHSFSFGFPRPDHSGFLSKVKAIYATFGEHTAVVSEIPEGASKSPKDEQIDVIAWEPKPDGAAGKFYLLAQVASGANWVSKTISGGPIDSFHKLWFTRQPASRPVPSIFVPICMGNFIDGSCSAKIDADTYEFGHIFYRFRIPSLAAKGLELSKGNTSLKIERTDDAARISEWAANQIQLLKHYSNMEYAATT